MPDANAESKKADAEIAENRKSTAKDKLEWMKKFHLIVGQSSHYRE